MATIFSEAINAGPEALLADDRIRPDDIDVIDEEFLAKLAARLAKSVLGTPELTREVDREDRVKFDLLVMAIKASEQIETEDEVCEFLL